MARNKVEQVQCDRCKRMELQPIKESLDPKAADFDAAFDGQRLLYQDLCGSCRETVANLWKELKEWSREVKYTVIRNAPVAGDQAPPLAAPPNYTPTQPHSAAGVKR